MVKETYGNDPNDSKVSNGTRRPRIDPECDACSIAVQWNVVGVDCYEDVVDG